MGYVLARRDGLGLTPAHSLPERETVDICASFQRVVVETLLDRLFEAARSYQARSVGIAGGVSANAPKRWKDVWSAGHTVSQVHDVPDVAELVDRVAAEYESATR